MRTKVLAFIKIYYGYINLAVGIISVAFLAFSVFADPRYPLINNSDASPTFIILSILSSYMGRLLAIITTVIISFIVIYVFRNAETIAKFLKIIWPSHQNRRRINGKE